MKAPRMFLGLLALVILSVSCATDPALVVVPQDLSQKQIMQKGQAFVANGDWSQAEAYFLAGKTRFPTDASYVLEADYNIALIAVRTKDHTRAKELLTAIQTQYQGADGAVLPPQFAILVDNLLKDIAPKLPATPQVAPQP